MFHLTDPEALQALRYRLRTVYFGPLVMGLLILYVFVFIPQTREVYLGIIEKGDDVVQGLLGLAVVLFLCLQLSAWQRLLSTYAIDRMYPEHANPMIDARLLVWRNRLTLVCATLPLGGLVLGLVKLNLETQDAIDKFSIALRLFAGDNWLTAFPEFAGTTRNLSIFPILIALIVLLLFFIGFAAYRMARADNLPHRNWRMSRDWLVFWTSFGLAVVTIGFPFACHDCVVPVTQAIGPLATGSIVLSVLVFAVMTLSILSSIRRLPILGTIVAGMICWAVYQIFSGWGPRDVEGSEAQEVRLLPLHTRDQLHASFDEWFKARRAADFKGYEVQQGTAARYPAFIFAAQGGGIYATSAAATFLSAMQDACPGFAQHVFAISAVSGGAVGATLFNALTADRALVDTLGCNNDVAARSVPSSLSERTKRILSEDHLSPTLAMIWHDFVRKLRPNPAFDRSSVLERSFACAFEQRRTRWGCGEAASTDFTGLRVPFEQHWQPAGAAPALILNTTWVEPGFRVAFAPFPMRAISDGTLYSLYTSPTNTWTPPSGDFQVLGTHLPAPRSLIEAAFVSARFPLIVPAWSAAAELSDKSERRWNFVDGGYVDNSGATTALELYSALQKRIAEAGHPVDLYLVLLTDADAEQNPQDVLDGTRFSDIVAPITALLNVRSQLANRAVTRVKEQIGALEQLGPAGGFGRQGSRYGEGRVLIVNTTQRTFELPLGWKISATTDDIVRLMMGRPELCAQPRRGEKIEPKIADAVAVIRKNSCVKQRLVEILEGTRFKAPEVPIVVPK